MPKVEIKLLEMMARKNVRHITTLSEMTGISLRVLYEVVNGKRDGLQLSTIAKLCQVLECEIGELIEVHKNAS